MVIEIVKVPVLGYAGSPVIYSCVQGDRSPPVQAPEIVVDLSSQGPVAVPVRLRLTPVRWTYCSQTGATLRVPLTAAPLNSRTSSAGRPSYSVYPEY
ncbi:MAG: hypothetical protein A4E46_00927 [Methanosaeta sp. PtaU1.Bin016]|nr:MAG: hypothetical protein A4E46_00927 [Methanosaeta sp. PtaU1.Bin016]